VIHPAIAVLSTVGNFRKNDRIKPEEDRFETIYGRKWQEIVPAF
jgi:hypothetical protein